MASDVSIEFQFDKDLGLYSRESVGSVINPTQLYAQLNTRGHITKNLSARWTQIYTNLCGWTLTQGPSAPLAGDGAAIAANFGLRRRRLARPRISTEQICIRLRRGTAGLQPPSQAAARAVPPQEKPATEAPQLPLRFKLAVSASHRHFTSTGEAA